VTSIWIRRNTFTNRDINESKVRAAVIYHIQRGSRSLTHPFGDFGWKCVPGPGGCFPLHSTEHVGYTLGFAVVLVLVAVVAVAILSILIDFSREVDLRIGSDTLAVGVHPRSTYMACVVFFN